MQSLNVLIVGIENPNLIELIKNSKYLNKLFVASDNEIDGCITINFNTFKELAEMCKALQIDIVLINNEKWIKQGITNTMKQYHVNCLAATAEWADLAISHKYARTLLNKYNINVPQIITLPVEFPVLVKGNGVLKKANSLQDVIDIRQKIAENQPEISKTVFLEKYLHSEKHKVVSIYDGKHLLTFPNSEINYESLKTYSEKLEKMLIQENANFIGFINSEIIEDDGILYNTDFNFDFLIPETSEDILYICISALYQKLNELDI